MMIIAFAQLRNELSNGNLENWFNSTAFCDYRYIYDQNSDDGSKEYYKKFPNTIVTESPTNDFTRELVCKDKLLRKVLSEHPDVNWIFWLDGDTVLDKRLCENNGAKFKEMCNEHKEYDCLRIGHFNLWRSDTYTRLDSSFDWFDQAGRWSVWRNNGKLCFQPIARLHRAQYPDGLDSSIKIPYYLIHKGFADDNQIINRLKMYTTQDPRFWPRGKKAIQDTIKRFFNESNLNMQRIPQECIPDWYQINDDTDPVNKPSLRSIYGSEFVGWL
jgi:hypothetical protein